MEKILIADAGSTSTDWCCLRFDNDRTERTLLPKGRGINALLCSEADIRESLREAKCALKGATGEDAPCTHVYFYGAGCASPETNDAMRRLLCEELGCSDATVDSDMVGAALSLLGRREGIACILGTGSNSCHWDGSQIIHRIPSLGFILGDEGSGASLGKRLVADAFKGHLPKAVTDRLCEAHSLTLNGLLDHVYRQPEPNRWLASLVPFISDNLWNPYIFSLVYKEMRRFVRRNLVMYEGAHSLPIAVTGSVAKAFEPLLKKAAAEQGLKIAAVTASPLPGLADFIASQHTNPN